MEFIKEDQILIDKEQEDAILKMELYQEKTTLERVLKEAKKYYSPLDYLKLKFSSIEALKKNHKNILEAQGLLYKLQGAEEELFKSLKLRSKASFDERNFKFLDQLTKIYVKSNLLNVYNDLLPLNLPDQYQVGYEYFRLNIPTSPPYQRNLATNKITTLTENGFELESEEILSDGSKLLWFKKLIDIKDIKEKAQNIYNQLNTNKESGFSILNDSRTRQGKNAPLLYLVLEECFPSVEAYESGLKEFPYFVDFMENKPWPSAVEFDFAVKKLCGWGELDYAKGAIKHLEWRGQNNIKENVSLHYINALPVNINGTTLAWYNDGNHFPSCESTYLVPDLNQKFNQMDFLKSLIRPRHEVESVYPQLTTAKKLSDEQFNEVYLYLKGLRQRPLFLDMYYGEDGVYKDPLYAETIIDSHYWPPSALPYKGHDNAKYWYWPRPREGYVYIPRMGYINPAFYTTAYEMPVETPYGYQQRMALINRLMAPFRQLMSFVGNLGILINYTQKFMKAGAFLAKFMNPMTLAGDVLRSNKVTGEYFKAFEQLTGGFFGKVERVSGLTLIRGVRGEKVDMDAYFLEALDVALKIVTASAGGAGLVAAGAGILKEGKLGETELGRQLLSVAEIVAIAHIAEQEIEEAFLNYAKKEVKREAKEEIGQASGLNESILGRLALEAGTTSAQAVLEDKEIMDAVQESVTKEAKLEAAKSSPYGAIAVIGFNHMDNFGVNSLVPETLSFQSPLQFFDNIEWSKLGSKIMQAVKDTKAQDVKKYLGLAIAIKSGRISEEEAVGYLVQQEAIKDVERFEAGRPVKVEIKSEDEIKREKIQSEVNKYKAQENIATKMAKGEPPTSADIKLISQSNPSILFFSEQINNNLPESERGRAWSFLSNLGLPDFNFKLPNVNLPNLTLPEINVLGGKQYDFEVPQWMKVTVNPEVRSKFEEAMHKVGRNALDMMINDFLRSLFPQNVPVRRIGSSNPYEWYFFDDLGLVRVRPPLRLNNFHPMFRFGYLKGKSYDNFIKYMQERNIEEQNAIENLITLQARLQEMEMT